MKQSIGILCIVAAFVLVSCSKEAGEGGTSSIRGKVHARYYNDLFTSYLGEGYDPDEDVYIVYGDDATYSDHLKTNYDGSYEFKYLRKGTYRIFAYSKDSTFSIPAGKYAVIQEITIDKNNQEKIAADIEILD
jgi:hypothetical protein